MMAPSYTLEVHCTVHRSRDVNMKTCLLLYTLIFNGIEVIEPLVTLVIQDVCRSVAKTNVIFYAGVGVTRVSLAS